MTGPPYAKALLFVKNMAYIQIGNRYYVSQATLSAFLTQEDAVIVIEED